MYRVVIVEDTPADADLLRLHVERYAAETGEELRMQWVSSALEFSEARPPADLVFLDIEMPGMNGMEAASLMRATDAETPIVFVTNLAQYAVRGYEVGALDFVVKPVSYPDFALHMARAMRQLHARRGRSVAIQGRDDLHVVAMSDITHVTIQVHTLSFHLVEGSVVETRGSIAKAEEMLAGGGFVRVSSGCLVNLAHVRRVRGDTVWMDTGDELPVSRARKKPLVEAIATYLGGS